MHLDKFKAQVNNAASKGESFLFLIDFEAEKPLFFPLSKLEDDILFDFNGYTNFSAYNKLKSIKLDAAKIDKDQYQKGFDIVMDALNYGDSFLVNYTCKTPIETEESLKSIFINSRAPYKMLYKNEFTFFSPETFIKIKDQHIHAFPMKGTIDANIPGAQQKLLNNFKEKAEHNTIVDLIRNDLSMVSKNVHVKRFRYLDLIQKPEGGIYQMSSEIVGQLEKNFHEDLGDIILKLLPAGSISGAPKKKTIQVIQKAETEKRHYYTGVAGIFDGKNLDSCVMIRYIENDNNQLYYRSGGGITHLSHSDAEYEEIYHKIYVPLN